ncbi:hypothetical protein VTJ04DRAFT_7330 [Mycothermus thermophilus]|uniref:uncharacterized protein n=1 Tax=Humicola insolens TaxID=85995 RepID=UPI003743FEB3
MDGPCFKSSRPRLDPQQIRPHQSAQGPGMRRFSSPACLAAAALSGPACSRASFHDAGLPSRLQACDSGWIVGFIPSSNDHSTLPRSPTHLDGKSQRDTVATQLCARDHLHH